MGISAVLAAAVATTFNLVCSGTLATGMIEKGRVRDFKSEPFTMIYRVDLASRRWCTDECEETKPIVSVSDTRIVFLSQDTPELSLRIGASVNRESGEFQHHLKSGDFSALRQGTCEPAPFTGFPARKF
jgi:hypothetical protein